MQCYGVAKPCRVTVCGLPVAVSVTVSVPLRVTPRAAAARLVNLTDITQEPPGAMAAPVQVSGPARAPFEKKNVRSPPPVVVVPALVTVSWGPPAADVLVKVTVPVPVAVPVGKVIVSGLGVSVIVALAVVPVPVRVTGEPVTVAPV